MAFRDIKLREEAFIGYETLPNKGTTLTWEETDDNFVGLFQRLYDAIPYGSYIDYAVAVAPDGYLYCDGSTFGAGTHSSTPVFASSLYQKLFILLWDACRANATNSGLLGYDNTGALINGDGNLAGSGTSGSSAWTSGYMLTLPDCRAKFKVGAYANSPSSFKPVPFVSGGNITQDLTHNHTATFTGTAVSAHTHTYSGTTSPSGAIGSSVASATSSSVTQTVSINTPSHLHTIDFPIIHITDDSGPDEVLAPQHPTGVPPNQTDLTAESQSITTSPHNHTVSITIPAIPDHTHTYTGTTSSSGGHTPAGTIAVANHTLTATLIPPYFPVHVMIKYSYGR